MANPDMNQIRLFVLKLLGITSPEEEEYLSRQMQEHKNLSSLLKSLEDRSYYAERRQWLESLDTEKELATFLKRQRRPRLRLYKQAAAVLLLLAGSSFYLLHTGTGDKVVFPELAASSHPVEGVVLTLSNGNSQILDGQTLPIIETDGSRIQSDSCRLDYTEVVTKEIEKPVYNQLAVARGFEYMLTLQDGTKVWLNAESKLEYPVKFLGPVRQVKLSGEAYFEVTRDTTRPFSVEVNGQFEVNVLGTSFNIKAYPGDDQAETTLVQGKVAIGSIILQPSEQAVFYKDREMEVRKVNVGNYTAWHEGWFYFENERLEQALEQLGRWYDIHFVFGDDEVRHLRLTGKLRRFENLTVLLEMLSSTSGCQFEVKGRTVSVK